MNIKQEFERLLTQSEVPEVLYYQITLRINDTGNIEYGIQTSWCGYTKTKPQREIREGRLFYGEEQKAYLTKHGEPPLLINDENDLEYFYLFGGHALIIEQVGRKKFKRLIEPHECLYDSGGLGFRSLEGQPSSKTQCAPSKKLRMKVLTRDNRRCLICGRSPLNYVDVELHVHHAIPWGNGGITEEENLITLCKTCHDGLDPHKDWGIIQLSRKIYPRKANKYTEELNAYQKCIKKSMQISA